MANVRDLWTKKNPDTTSRKKRIQNSRWGIGKRWQVEWIENGKRITKTFDNRDAAELHASRAEVGIDDGTWITKDKLNVTLKDMWEIWFASKAGKAKKTQSGYQTAWNHIAPVWGNKPCHDIGRAEIAAWIPTIMTTARSKDKTPRQLGSGSQRKIGIVINALLEQAEELNIIHKNPVKSSDIPRQTKSERRYLKIAEIDALLEAAPTDQSHLLLLTLLMTGIRPGEAKGLKIKDFDADRQRLYIRRDVDDLGNIDETKTGNHRDVPIDGDLLLDLEDSAEGRNLEDWLIPDEYGNVWTSTRWRRVWEKICTQAGIPNIDTYTLKHTAASMAIASGADAKTVQRMLGHSSAAMTLDVYGHLWDEGLDAIPGAMAAHMEFERRREAEKLRQAEVREAEREARRAARAQKRLRVVKDDEGRAV